MILIILYSIVLHDMIMIMNNRNDYIDNKVIGRNKTVVY